MFRRVLVANRGEIACRIIRALHELGAEAVAVHSDADRYAEHVRQADDAVRLGPGPPEESYLRGDLVLAAALDTGAEAIHPGYGFLSESAPFARTVEAAGLAFVGPTPEQIERFGDKHVARQMARQVGVPLLPGSGIVAGLDEALAAADQVGYPVMLKASAGGGGIGMRVCGGRVELTEAFEVVTRLAATHFGCGDVLVERFLPRARHVEVQVFGDGEGHVVALGERDCSLQRRNQKVIEETPAPNLPAVTREALIADAVRLAEAARYRSAGTVELLVDAGRGEHFFLEVNTRLQVEHGVTELVHGIDLVAWMLRLAAGDRAMIPAGSGPAAKPAPEGRALARHLGTRTPDGHAIEARVYAENPMRGFQPSVGWLTRVELPDGPGIRCDGWVRSGTEVTPFYDPLLLKVMARGTDRAEAIARLGAALGALRLDGIETNVEHLRAALADERFLTGDVRTRLLEEMPFTPQAIEVVPGKGSGEATIVSYPGRVGYWSVGVPPSGPMDDWSFRLGNRLLGNPEDSAGLECAVVGPSLRFHRPATICLTGADMQATVHLAGPGDQGGAAADLSTSVGRAGGPGGTRGAADESPSSVGRAGGPGDTDGADSGPVSGTGGEGVEGSSAQLRPVPRWEAVAVPSGALLRLGPVTGPGARAYLLVHGGIDVPEVLGSRTTFTLGGFGGHAGRALLPGDLLELGAYPAGSRESTGSLTAAGDPEPVGPGGTAGDMESVGPAESAGFPGPAGAAELAGLRVPDALIPELSNHWELAVLDGPHAAPEYLTSEDVDLLYRTDWEVHYNSARTGVRLVGPRLQWARTDGGEAGLHPSNIHDNAYAVGTVDFTGDMPVILGPDGPSLGGFVCPATVIDADLWKLGQLRAGDTVRLVPVTPGSAANARRSQAEALAALALSTAPGGAASPGASDSPGRSALGGVGTVVSSAASSDSGGPGDPVLVGLDGPGRPGGVEDAAGGGLGAPARLEPRTGPARTVLDRVPQAEDGRPELTFRRSGDRHLLVEVGPPILDLDLRVRVQQLADWFGEEQALGVSDLTPGIRSLQVQVDGERLTVERAVDLVRRANRELPPVTGAVLPSRVVHLPLSWEDPATLKAVEVYRRSVRPDAPWCPSNLEFIRRINGLDSVEEVRRVAFEAEYVVYGLGDVYLGAPVATPLDPRHRLVTTKYNPARTWTPENAVGIGGAYLCVYGMEGPGGYQLIGRTTQMWQRWPEEDDEAPWLLRHFDRIRFYPVEADELTELRADCAAGKWRPVTEPGSLSVAEHHRFLASIEPSLQAARERQQAAFAAERAAWEASGELDRADAVEQMLLEAPAGDVDEVDVPDGAQALVAPLTARVWSVTAKEGDDLEPDAPVVVLEAMKTETTIRAPAGGKLLQLCCAAGDLVAAGQTLAVVEEP